ncbi:hypothetical protein KAFR_0G03280 [Kazachstania africana CBS 2517]|uniref:Uncharacterized protein n=1 Tax=Kazachstania africana (strain ATCC 22294 / BCRC 22015 / CBS 2517 / CECT 1963 / NBRC 1671 / NRRL Y-8276) TaxID=1071382 RepID=H2AYB0_KAZAF|nr:hypothetical protein KAFR_0G03280 [Kazachstania africana CBS 2517]CCF59360.1 hypothetical protein KAFR_0G03280 [Kazachstania africana CBS 2517]
MRTWLSPALLNRHRKSNALKIQRLLAVLQIDSKDVNCHRLTPYLYPAHVQDKFDGLIRLSSTLMNLQILQQNMSFYRRSPTDINNFDFNCFDKSAKNSRYSLLQNGNLDGKQIIKQFLTKNNLSNLANLPIPSNKLPTSIRFKFNRDSLLMICGHLIMCNYPDTHFMSKIMKG